MDYKTKNAIYEMEIYDSLHIVLRDYLKENALPSRRAQYYLERGYDIPSILKKLEYETKVMGRLSAPPVDQQPIDFGTIVDGKVF